MNCIFGLFDILGFKSFCENCDSKSSEAVLAILDEFETDVPQMVWLELGSGQKPPPDKTAIISNRLRWLTFSDTVFVAMPIEVSDHPDTLKFNLIFFAILVKYINRRMFEIGLTERFLALGKTLNEKDKDKIRNTEKLFKDWQAANHLNYLKDKFHCS